MSTSCNAASCGTCPSQNCPGSVGEKDSMQGVHPLPQSRLAALPPVEEARSRAAVGAENAPPARFEMPGLRYPATPRSGPDPEILPNEAARAATVSAISDAFAAASRWHEEAYATCLNEDGGVVPDQQRRDAAGPAPRALIQITPGCGKTRALKDFLTQNRSHPAVLVTPLSAEADGYANDIPGAVRRRPRTGTEPGQCNHCMMQAGYVTMPDGRRVPIKGVDSPLGGNVTIDTPEQEHPTSHICHSGNCPKAAGKQIDNPNSRLSPYEKERLQKKLKEQYTAAVLQAIDDEPCFVYDEVPNALCTPVTTVTALGFSDSDAKYKKDPKDKESINKTIGCDESQTSALGHIRTISAADLTKAMEDIRSWKSRMELEIADLHLPRAIKQVNRSEKFAAYREERLREIKDDLLAAANYAPILVAIRDDAEDLAGKGGFARPPLERTVACIRQGEVNITKMRATSEWEVPLWKRLEQMIRLPLRLLAPLIQGVMDGSAVVTPDGIQVFYERPLLTSILDRRHSVIVSDGNPSPTIKAIFGHDQDSATTITRIVAEQHISINIDPRFTHGIPAQEQRSAAADKKEGQEIADTADSLTGDRPMLILANKYRAEAVTAVRKNAPKTGEAVGHWERHNRATNEFISHDIMIWYDPARPREAQMEAWRLHRAILIRAGVRKPEEIPIGDFSEIVYRERVFYRVGDADIQNPAREHGDPEIRVFLRELQFNEKWQGLCRIRGVNADPESPLHVYICGGMAMDHLHEQGIRDSQITFKRLVNKKSHKERCQEQTATANERAWVAAAEVGATGGTITRDAINDHLRATGEAGISNTVYRRATGDPAWTERFSGQAARTGRGAAAAKARQKLVDTCRTAGRTDLVEAAAKEAFEVVERCGGDTTRIIEYAHGTMSPGKENLRSNLAGWLLIDTYGTTDADRYPPAFPQPPPAAA